MPKEIQSSECNTRAASMLAGMVISKLQHLYQCKLEKCTTEGNILLDGKDTGVKDVPANVLCDILDDRGYRAKYGVMPEQYPVWVAK